MIHYKVETYRGATDGWHPVDDGIFTSMELAEKRAREYTLATGYCTKVVKVNTLDVAVHYPLFP
jgi:hypothetical protein